MKKDNKNNISKEYTKEDIAYMNSLAQAVLAKNSHKTKTMLYLVLVCILGLIVWMGVANVDEITRGQGKVIPSGQNQVIQNLEGGIVQEILVREGDIVKKGQILVKIDNKSFESSLAESGVKLSELLAKKIRLFAQAYSKDFNEGVISKEELEKINSIALNNEKSLFNTNKLQLNAKISQKESEIKELNSKISYLTTNLNIAKQEQRLVEDAYKKGSVSKIDYLQGQRKVNDIQGELSQATIALPKAKEALKEIQLSFTNDSKKELNEVNAEIARISKSQIGLDDKVERTLVKSPVNGIISKMNIHTVSGVIKPGMDIAEIVPLDDKLIAEVKVKPADVAFLREDLPATLKFSAYDFSIYGGLKGKVLQISADTETNEKGESYYLVRIVTDKNHLGTDEHPLDLKVGMIVTADIITGKKTILDYLLKPIFKTKQNALRER
ncbi:HlyD family type I secretion periplasmic adaptor subunit [Campylobacter canadensis]|uniref:HlyD family type I secretion periplasmic adaptor subunit n=1 Tax=Campylobacter canadensis TaxID=449520 RepID=A0ABS7WQP0_9BACT|nr:HlyD family type I secretion periplasmic adaptor subunit [Campylobacter canadensis]MBZ7986617.1 HlyD family type I secretion periplasmic adaptor subunit [Campylobacter canadensis]MBZ7993978.1 HlyD family type I secretion periplasmic adaptor subunit [Campylobacter canadensis]MBZ7996294.1 HlyD family type I secretion periplasmic adaptor subunit [Campylobacter canadensis]MBZ7997653.1 HlyD family type I secretion periplasmic adaptor subunit [Campylobacter canadensis]MBZ7999310.1 HlyD family typ